MFALLLVLVDVPAPERPPRTTMFAPRRASWEQKLESRNLSAVSDAMLWTPSLEGKA